MKTNEEVDVISYLEEKFPDLDPDEGLKYPCRYLIDSSHIPVFTEAIHTLMEFGLNLLFFPDINGITIKNCNISRTASGHVFFSTEFFGAVRTYEWPDTVPCASISVRDMSLLLKKMDKHRNIDYLILDLEPLADGLVMRITYRNGIDTILIIRTREVYANSLPKDEQPEAVTSVVNVLGREFKNVLTTLGKLKEVGLYISLFGVVLHTICSRALRSRSKKSAVQMRDLIHATLLVEESFIEVDVKDLLMLSRFSASNDEVMKFYFTESESPLFIVVDMSGLCSITFILSTGMVDPVMTRNVIHQMIPALTEDGHVTSIRLYNNEAIDTCSHTVINCGRGQMDEDEFMDRMVLGISGSRLQPRQEQNTMFDDLHNLSLNAWNNDQVQITQSQSKNEQQQEDLLLQTNVNQQNIVDVVGDAGGRSTRDNMDIQERSQGRREDAPYVQDKEPIRNDVLEMEVSSHDQQSLQSCNNLPLSFLSAPSLENGRAENILSRNGNNVDPDIGVRMIAESLNEKMIAEQPIAGHRTETVENSDTFYSSTAQNRRRQTILEFLDREDDNIEVCSQQPLRRDCEFDLGVIPSTAPPFVLMEAQQQYSSIQRDQIYSLDRLESINQDHLSRNEDVNERPNAETKLHRSLLFESINVTNFEECTRDAFLYQRVSVLGKGAIPMRFQGGGQVIDTEPEILRFINLKHESFWRSAFSVRPLETNIEE